MIGDHFYVPFWVVILCNFVIALGTCFGGWRIVKTMGMKITKLKPHSGFCSDTASAFTIAFATSFGIPVSTTHTVTGAIVGVGSVNGFSAVVGELQKICMGMDINDSCGWQCCSKCVGDYAVDGDLTSFSGSISTELIVNEPAPVFYRKDGRGLVHD